MKFIVVFMFVMLTYATAQQPDKFMQRMIAKMRRNVGETEVGEPLTIVDRLIKRGVSSGDAEKFVQAHNKARQRAWPTPKDEQDMEWDDTLASTAQKYADKCIWEHNHHRSDESEYFYVGENLYVTTAQGGVEPSAAVKAWESESNDYHYETKTCNPGRMCGHYTQVSRLTTDGCF
ncbi:peptidase inhibitor 16-like [Pecten maximus]|uniref:peptidase inhibitor 16-like n=1 Tax=Pecten maximus TaxID=6579 RepID=UPI00145914ED|nr:peptidase inhibitor 16-like [Pecten maximus]